MRFREFYNDSVFTLLAKDSANWDYYAMQYQGGKPAVVALAKPGSGQRTASSGPSRSLSGIWRCTAG